MNIPKEQVKSKKQVGKLGGQPVYELETKGGLHMVFVAKGGSFETLGVGPHRSLSRHIAKKKESDIQWSDLAKADFVDPIYYQNLLPKYEGLTEAVRKAQGL